VGGRREEVAQTRYTHVSKCKNDKIKERKKWILFSRACMRTTWDKVWPNPTAPKHTSMRAPKCEKPLDLCLWHLSPPGHRSHLKHHLPFLSWTTYLPPFTDAFLLLKVEWMDTAFSTVDWQDWWLTRTLSSPTNMAQGGKWLRHLNFTLHSLERQQLEWTLLVLPHSLRHSGRMEKARYVGGKAVCCFLVSFGCSWCLFQFGKRNKLAISSVEVPLEAQTPSEGVWSPIKNFHLPGSPGSHL
jgi:hypothetical protein